MAVSVRKNRNIKYPHVIAVRISDAEKDYIDSTGLKPTLWFRWRLREALVAAAKVPEKTFFADDYPVD